MTWLLVTGGRGYELTRDDLELLDKLDDKFKFTVLVHGDAHGADRGSERWWRARRLTHTHGWVVPILRVEAAWDRLGASAGPRRNQAMVELCRRHSRGPRGTVCVAFLGGRGTADCVRRAREAGFEVVNAADLAGREIFFSEGGPWPKED